MKALRSNLQLFALPALLLGLAPRVFLYDRTAIMHGEAWRLWTGHWVHFSASHLAWNLVVLLGAGTWLEQARPGLPGRFTLVGAPLISLGLLGLTPAMQAYGGLSGLATGVLVLLALVQLQARAAERGWWIGLLGLVAAKILHDATHAGPLLSRFETGVHQASAAAHVLGAGLAAAAFLFHRSAMCRTPSFSAS
ncbi:MAG: rhombosortase [Opitutae bacterium]|nr:rhombosortase [Opitutae bacterium]